MSARRILHVTPFYEHAWAYGGMPRVASALADALAARGHAVTVCTTDACTGTARWTPECATPARTADRARDTRDAPAGGTPAGTAHAPHGWHVRSSSGVDVHVFPNLSNRVAFAHQLFLPRGMGAWLRAHAASFDIAHLHACRNLPGLAAARALTRAGVPYVVAPNGTAPRHERQLAAKFLVDATIGRGFLSRAAGVIAVSEAESRDLVRLGVPEGRIIRVPNPVTALPEAAPRPAQAFRARFGLGDAPFVLYLGQISPRKRLDVLVEAFARAQAAHACLVIAGAHTAHTAAIRTLAGARGIADRVVFTDLLAGDERFGALGAATVVAYATEREVFGLVPLEALLAGTPVIVAGDSGCAEVVRASGGGAIVPPRDAAALASAIRLGLEGRIAARDELERAARHVRAHYDPRVVADRCADAYERVIATARATATAHRPAVADA